MCGYVCIELIDFMLKGKRFLDYTIIILDYLFSTKHDENNDKIILKYFQ